MADDEEEVDYMSDDILFACTKNDIRPGLINNRAIKRKIEVENKRKGKHEENKKRMRPIKEIQEEKLQEGLGTAIDTSNKGFAMLQKMGYKPGTSLGKDGKGRLEPVKVVLKSDRVGLGWQQILQQKRQLHEERRLLRRQRREELCDPEQYRARMSSKHHEKMMHLDLTKSQKMCYTLDLREGILTPHEDWFWPSYALSNEEEDEDVTEENCDQDHNDEYSEDQDVDMEILEPSEQLEVITSYLRSTYFYCIWCSSDYDGQDDLSNNCPGSTRAEHGD